MIPEVEAEVRYEVAKVNAKPPEAPNPKADFAFVTFAEQAAAAMVKAAELVLSKAQQAFDHTKVQSADMLARVHAKELELKNLGTDIESFSKSLLEAHKQFHNGGKDGAAK